MNFVIFHFTAKMKLPKSTYASQSQIFSPFRAVGYVSNHVPFVLDVKGSESFVTTVVGKSFHIYNCSKLNLVFVGEVNPGEHDIVAIIAVTTNKTVVAAASQIYLYQRGKVVQTYTEHESDVQMLTSLGDYVISIDVQNNVNVWSHQTLETYLSFRLDLDTFKVTACVHPSTYLNKILFGSSQGKLQLWNIRTNTLVHEFAGWDEQVVVLEQAPAVDVIAVGLHSGRIQLHNFKYDKTLMTFYQEFGLVTSIAFRTDGPPIMATGSGGGHITVWDLEKREYKHTLYDAHTGTVTGVRFLQKQPLLVSSGSDNSLKIWIFDNPDGSGRLLKSRSGHSGPPTSCMFYGSYGNVILTSGQDRALRYTAIMRGEQCHEFSQGSLGKMSKKSGMQVEDLRLPPVTCLAACKSREDDWDNVVTCHVGMKQAVTWTTKKRSVGAQKLTVEGNTGDIACAVDISSCGNFVVVGYHSGDLHKFNIQSGHHRGVLKGHKGRIKGVSIDTANLMAVSTSADASIRFWDFKKCATTATVACHCPVVISKLHRESSLLAVAFDDFSMHMYDIDTQRLVRKLPSHTNVITDFSWSSDARWIVSVSMDGTVKVSDIPSSRLIDCFLVDSPATSCAFSPSGEFLVTTHQDNVGMYLWSNKVTYSGVHPTPLPNDYQPAAVLLPTTQTEVHEVTDEDAAAPQDEEEGMNTEEKDYKSPEQLASFLVTLSSMPESRWRSLMHLDLIKKRNKPKQPPKKPKAAPFFLPTISGLEMTFDTSQKDADDEEAASQSSRLLSSNNFSMDSLLNSILKTPHPKQADVVMETLMKLSPSEIDAEFRQLGVDGGGSDAHLAAFVSTLSELTKRGKDFEMVQSYVSLFLKLHGDAVGRDEQLRTACEELLTTIKNTWFHCEQMVNQSTCLVNYLRSATV